MSHDDSHRLITALMRGGFIAPQVFTLQTPAVLTNLANVTATGYGVKVVAAAGMPTTPDGADLIRLVNCHNTRLLGFTFDGNAPARGKPQPSDSTQASIGVWGGSDVTIADCTFTGAVNDDVFVCASTGPACTDPGTIPQWVTLKGNRHLGPAYRQQVSVVHGHHVRVSGCQFRDQASSYTGTALDMESNPGDLAGALSDVFVDSNTFDNCNLGIVVNGTADPADVQVARNAFTGGVRGVLNLAAGTLIDHNTFNRLKGISITNNAPAKILGNRMSCCGDLAVYFNEGAGGSLVAENVADECCGDVNNPWSFQLRFAQADSTCLRNVARVKNPPAGYQPFLCFQPTVDPAWGNTLDGVLCAAAVTVSK